MHEGFDVIFMSVVLPILDGLAAASMMKKANYRGPIVPMAFNVTEEDVCIYQNYGKSLAIPSMESSNHKDRHGRPTRETIELW